MTITNFLTVSPCCKNFHAQLNPFPVHLENSRWRALAEAAFAPRQLADRSPSLGPKVCHGGSCFHYSRIALVYG